MEINSILSWCILTLLRRDWMMACIDWISPHWESGGGNTSYWQYWTMVSHDNSPKRRGKKTTNYTIKSILRDCTDIVWSPGSDREPQEANLAWNSGNTVQIPQVWCKIGCRSAFLLSIEFNTVFQCWIEFWLFGALNGSHGLYHALTYQEIDFQRVWGHLFFRRLGDLS